MIPEVSAIVPTYNRRAMASEAAASVLAQRGADFELIVVDDGSSDGTLAHLAAAYGSNPALRLTRIKHRGPAAARNHGVSLARAPFIAFLDSDDLWAPDKLSRQLSFMRGHPQCSISQSDEIWIRNGRRVNPGRRHLKRAGDIFADSLRTCLISPSAVIMSTKLFRAIGGFDEDFAAAEDYDLWLRILAQHQVGLLDEPLVTRRAGHRDQLSATVPAIDRFRILALLKLLQAQTISQVRRDAVAEVLIEKCAIYSKGLRRRGRIAQADLYDGIASQAESWRGCADASVDRMIAAVRSLVKNDRTTAILGDNREGDARR